MALGLLVGCGDRADEQTADDSTSQSPSPTDSSSPAEPSSSAASPSASSPTSDPTTQAPSSPSPTPADPAPAKPACSEVWRAGETLPRGYDGCVDGGTVMAADGTGCSFGKQLFTYGNHFYAVPNGRIHRTTKPLSRDKGYRSAMASCMG